MAPQRFCPTYFEYVSLEALDAVSNASRFLDSEILTLRPSVVAAISPYSFKIHKKLLASKSEQLIRKYETHKEFSGEGELSLGDSPAEITVRFVEWAYTGDYPDCYQDASAGVKTEGSNERAQNGTTQSEHATEEISCTVHLDLYIFSTKYEIWGLRDLSRTKLGSSLEEMSESADGQKHIVEILEKALRDPEKYDDPILGTLAQFAAWHIESLRNLSEFRDLLRRNIWLLKKVLCAVRRSKSFSW